MRIFFTFFVRIVKWACGIATTTNNMLNLLRDSNPNAQILTTRKTLPFAKKLCLKAVLDGGGQIHRLSLSDSVIFFDHHIKAGGGFEAFCKKIPLYKQTLIEKKIIAECENAKSAKMLLKAGIDGIQCDKFSLKELKEVYEYKNSNFKNTFVIAAGGINLSNIAEFGKFCDAVVTSAPYHAKPSDLGVKIDITN
ncbi:MAG: hypothetical protein MR902_07365 [Campylobacter sp.]|nr:hypothetical protein [Campylobacter sp.]